MFERLKSLFSSEPQSTKEEVNIPAIVEKVRQKESKENIPLGRRIHSFGYRELDLFLDRDITKNYRVTVYQGRERLYSFSIFAKQGNYDILEEGYARIFNYLDGERKVSDLPADKTIKGFFYGH